MTTQQIKTGATSGGVGYYTLFIAARSADDEARRTIPHLLPLGKRSHKLGGCSNVVTKATTYAFTHKSDRDFAYTWLLRYCAERGLDVCGIVA